MESRTLHRVILLIAVLVALSACATRSISDSGYRGDGRSGANPFYRGELSAYDVIGVDLDRGIPEEEIRADLVARQPISIKKGSAIMLVQSGAIFADPDMASALERYYTVASFTGVPLQDTRRPDAAQPRQASYSQLFRLAAAKGGLETIVVYWGLLESASAGLGTKAVSWVPIIGGVIPDQSQRMRIRLMVAVIDTRTGQWETFLPEPFEDEAISSQHGRGGSDQEQVAFLKAKAYKAAAEALVTRYAR